jgi:hypothetical protein
MNWRDLFGDALQRRRKSAAIVFGKKGNSLLLKRREDFERVSVGERTESILVGALGTKTSGGAKHLDIFYLYC